MAHSYSHLYRLPATGLRFFTVYGPWGRPDMGANLEGFVNVLEGCRHHGCGHLVYASSSSVYGANTKLPFSVDDKTDHPISLYAATKEGQ